MREDDVATSFTPHLQQLLDEGDVAVPLSCQQPALQEPCQPAAAQVHPHRHSCSTSSCDLALDLAAAATSVGNVGADEAHKQSAECCAAAGPGAEIACDLQELATTAVADADTADAQGVQCLGHGNATCASQGVQT